MSKPRGSIPSGEFCRCRQCGFEGYCYGVAHAAGVSAPWCPQCEKNNKLTPIPTIDGAFTAPVKHEGGLVAFNFPYMDKKCGEDMSPETFLRGFDRGGDMRQDRGDDPDQVQCGECGNVQGFAGWNVACEECGAVDWAPFDEEHVSQMSGNVR